MRKAIIVSALLFTVAVLDNAAIKYIYSLDRFFWPESAHRRIESMAEVLRKMKAPARWCYPADNHESNIVLGDLRRASDIAQCFAKLTPLGPFVETPREYIKRYYGASIDGYVCEVTLSTEWDNAQFVGSICYYGLYRMEQYPGLGASDAPFG